jgi:N-acetylmuramoyl-L-alanine amidase
MKVYLSGSTQSNNKGVGNYGTEADRMQELARKVQAYIEAGNGGILVYRNNVGLGLQGSINDSNSKLGGQDIHMALHTNAGGGKGTECYYWGGDNNASSIRIARLLFDRVAPLTKSADRGVKSDHSLFSNGLAELRETNAAACLIEIIFHDNLDDVNDYLSKIDKIALAIAYSMYDFFGVQYKQALSDKDLAVQKLRSVSIYADSVWIPVFDKIAKEGKNIWGLINKL